MRRFGSRSSAPISALMPRSFADENQRWDAFRQVISNVRDELKDILSVGNDGTVLGEDLHVVPRVAKIYREYANGILKACAILRVVRGGGLKSYIYLEHYYCNNLQRYVLNGQD